MILLRHIFLLLLFCSIGLLKSHAQAIQTEFGKNRVQYHNDFTSYSKYETENVITYWYGKARNVAQATIQIAELEHNDIQELLEYRMNDKIELVVYTDLSDLKQSNIGNEEVFNNTKGETKTVGKKAFVYFNGDHKHLRSQIRQGIASVYINNIINGSSLQEVVQNAILLNLPSWFQKGLTSFADESWNAELNTSCRYHLQNEKLLDFDKYAELYPREAGHSMWHFLENKYGRTKISQIVYITRIYRSLDGSFPYVLNLPFEEIKQAWAAYYSELYSLGEDTEVVHDAYIVHSVKKKHNQTITHLSISPHAKYIAYVVNELGRQDVEFLDIASGETSRLLRNDKRNPFQASDTNYPLITWHPSGESLFILYEKHDVKYLKQQYLHDLKEFEIQDVPENYQRIYSMDYVNGDRMLFSGTYNGLSDLFYYKIKSRSSEKITEDFWDDLDASYITYKSKSGILFTSNRETFDLTPMKLDTILPLGGLNLFFLEDGSDEVIQLTNTITTDNTSPKVTSDGKLLYLVEKQYNTLLNAKQFLGTDAPTIIKDPKTVIHQHDIADNGTYTYVSEDIDFYHIYLQDILDMQESYTLSNPLSLAPVQEAKKPSKESIKTYADGKKFQSKFPDSEGSTPVIEAEEEEAYGNFGDYYNNYYTQATNKDGRKIIKFEPYRANAARLKFRIYEYGTWIDNEPLFEGLETFNSISQSIRAQPTTIHTSAKVKDIFEDYTLVGGFRIPTALNGSEFYLTLEHEKNRWDKSYTLYRKMDSEFVSATSIFDRFKRHTIMGRAQFKYPFSIFKSLRLTGSLRLDRSFFSVTDINRLDEPVQFDKRLSARAEYVYDDTYDVLTNIKNGTRYKVFFEAINSFNLELRNGLNIKPSTGFTGIFGFDARHYVPILRKSVLALRGAGSTSFGSQTMLYYLGGMENWFLAQYDDNVGVPQELNYTYVAIAPHLRGFNHNIRNGGSYLISNIELRVPVFSMLFGNRIRSGFLRNLQVTGFLDAGLAWHGASPYSDVNPLNDDQIVTTSTTEDILVLNITYFRDPLAYGYGWGLRTTLLGYYVKFDYAYGVETGIAQSPKWYFSLGYDF